MTQKALQKIESKERILNVASRLFKKQGFAATGIDQVMLEAGMTAGGFYAHFKSKEDLLQQSLVHAFRASRLQMNQGNILRRYLSTAHRDLPEKGCILPALAAEIYRAGDDSQALVSEHINEWIRLLGLEKRELALVQIAQAIGAVLLSRMAVPELSDEILQASLNSLDVEKFPADKA